MKQKLQHFLVCIGLFILPLTTKAQCDAPITSMFSTNGLVNASVFDPVNNVYYIGGDFTVVNTFYTQGALVSNSSGAPDRTHPVVAGGNVLASVSDGAGGFYIAGAFTIVGGLARNRLAHINSAGQVTAWNPNADNLVNAIAISGSTIYVGGAFANVGGQARNFIAAIDATTGLATSWNPNANNSINVLAINGSTVYTGGLFTTIGGQTRNNIGALDITTGLATTWNPNADFLISAMAISGSNVYVGGTFTNIGGQARARIAALDMTTGLATAWNPAASAQVNVIMVNGTTVYAGGAFTTIGGQARNRIAGLDISTGLATTWNPNASSTVRALAMNGTNVLCGGDFVTIGGQSRNRIAEIDGAGLATSWNPNANSSVFTLTKDGASTYVGGGFATIGGVARNRVAALDATTGVATSWNPDINNSVYALALSGTTVYAGGLFTTVGGTARNRIAAINSSTGIASAWDPNASASVNALAVSGSTVYAGGAFTTIGGQTRTRLAALDAATGLATTWDPSAGNTVKTIAVSGSSVYIGGLFTTAGGQARNRIAEIDATTGLATTWNPAASAVVNTVLVNSGTVYVGGAFSTIGGQSRLRIAAISAATGLATAWNPSADALVYGLGVSGSTLYASGAFTTIGGQARNSVAGLNISDGLATSWNPNVAITVYTLCVGTPSIYIGGDFTSVGGNTANRNSSAFSFGGITISSQPSNASICAGANTSFSITASGVTSYQWEVSTDNGATWNNATGGIYSNSTTATLTLTNATVTYNNYQYRCVVSGGSCSSGTPSSAAILTINSTPTITGTTPASRCGTGTLTLGATSSAGTINWYSALTGGTSLGTGTSFTTPSISSTTTYYVDATNAGCTSSPRIAVIATVNTMPTITGTTPASRCGTGTLTLGATASAGTINWYDALTAGTLLGTGTSFTTPSISVTTTYYVEVTNAGCTSSPRTAVVATVNSTPTISGTTPASRCGTGTVTLGASASAGTINWYSAITGGTSLGTGTSFTTPSISTTTTYYVDATNAGCTSSPRTAVSATVNTIPTITGTTPATRCGTGTLVLAATASSGTINWYDALTGGTLVGSGTSFTTPSISVTTTYYVEAINAGCTSSPRSAVVATVNAIPTITGTTPASRCGAGTLTLGATASAGTIDWYDALTGGTLVGTGTSFTTPSIGSTTTYYVEATNAGCTSSPRISVIATVNNTTSITGTTPDSRCDAGTLTLGATASAGTLNWYDAPTVGTLVGTGTSFTTPSISVTTTYYVDATSAGCTSARTAVVATVNTTPTITGTTPASRCDVGTVTLAATASAGTINWYSALTGGTLLGTGTTYTTPSIAVTTTYYIEVTNAGCTSSPRLAVIATVNTTPTITGTTPASRCGTGTLSLSATASGGTINWYSALTGGTLLGTGASYTTPSISATTTYYVSATNGGCTSSPRTAVVATINAIPTITGTTPASICDAGTVALSATASAGTINWYDALTGGTLLGSGTTFTTPSISSTTTYFVEVTNAGCTSSPRTSIVATVTTTPAILTTTPASRCGTGTLSLAATTSGGTINWYSALTGGTLLGTGVSFTTPSISVTTIYYAEATNAGCADAPRTAVVATVNATPTITGTTPASICDAGTLTLGATASAGTINWYDAPTGGTLVGTGSSFTTPSISSTTTYYVDVTNIGCTSARTAVIATVNNTPSVIGTTPASRCDAGTLTLGATTSAGTISWYDALTGGTLVGTGTSYTTTSISTTTSYFVEVSNAGCTATPRVEVIATVNTTPTITGTTPASRCGTGTLSLGATASAGTINWYSALTGGTLLGSGTTFTTPSISSTTTYYVSSTNGGCTSSPRIAVVATVTPIPLRPTNTTPAANLTICSGTSTVLTVSGVGTIGWYSAATGGTYLGGGNTYTTPILFANTTFYAQDSTCASSTLRRAIAVNTVDVIAPVFTVVSNITQSTDVGQCSAVVTFAAPSATDNCTSVTITSNHISGETFAVGTTMVYDTARDASGNTTIRSFSITVNDNQKPIITCPSNVSVALSAGTCVVTGLVLTSPVTSDNCGVLSVTNNAPSSYSVGTTIVKWYVTDIHSNIDSCSQNVVVTGTPSAPSAPINTTPIGNLTICSGSTTTLSVSGVGTISWYTASAGGTYLGTGTNFTTPILSTSTTYFVQDSNCLASSRTAITVTVNTTPTILFTVPSSRCDAGSVTLDASASVGTINWYNALTGGTLVGTGTPFTTPAISSTTTYYASATNAGCTSSPRQSVVATVYTTPTITTTTPATRCGAGSVTLGATTSAGIINWYDALTGGNLVGTGTSLTTSITGTTTYYVDATVATCSSSPRIAVIATVNPIPTFTSTTPASRCDAGTLTLGATASAGTINWYDALTGGSLVGTGASFTTPTISTTTTYYVDATNTGCTSSPRTAVVATVNTTPSITVTTPASRCDSGTLTLGATASAGTINWYDALTGGNLVGTGTSFTTPSISTTTSYYVDATNTGCTSLPRTTVVATVNITPSITTTSPASRCDAGSLTLGATASAGTINWYDALSGGNLVGTGTSFTTPSLNASTSYFVESTDNACTSSPRIEIIATVNTTPTVTGTTPATRCDAGTLVLGATGSAGTVNWFDSLTGGSLVGTGTSFTTPSINATTSYFVEVTNAGCTSSPRALVIATVNTTPSITITIPASRCDTGNLILSASGSAGTVNWYDSLTGGNLVGTGVSLTTPSISSTTSYYAEVTNTGCTSSPRIEVIATVNTTPSITGTTPASRCDAGTLTLGAAASTGIIDWYDALTGGTLVGTGTSFTTPVLSSSATYFAEVTNAGCTSTSRTPVTASVTIIDISVLSGTNILTSNQVAASYQWLNCSTGNSVIAGATSQSYSPTVSGTYAVMIGLNSCIDTSICTSIVVIGVEEYENINLSVYPNPSSGKVYVTSAPKGEYKVINELGQSVLQFSQESQGDVEFSLESFNNGVYYLIGVQNNKIIRSKIIISK